MFQWLQRSLVPDLSVVDGTSQPNHGSENGGRELRRHDREPPERVKPRVKSKRLHAFEGGGDALGRSPGIQ